MMPVIASSESFSSLAPALLNHLWQSTVFAVVAGAFTVLLRRNSARVRYGLWLAASIKFLIPLEVLAALGQWLPRPSAGVTQVAAYAVFDVAGRPVGGQAFFLAPFMSLLLMAAWICGVVAVTALWAIKGWGITRALRRAQRLHTGREVALLEELCERCAVRLPILLMPSDLRMEPGVAGGWRAKLLWPAGLSDRLSDAQMRAILVHELEHTRRRDNLTAMLHMLVEAIFWFHPLVWWMERRLIEERERACDEAVLQAGGRPGDYAEGLLEACRFCIEPPLACISGLGGAQLRTRVMRIVRGCAWQKMNWSRRLLLVCAAAVVIAMPVIFGQMSVSLKIPPPVAPPPPPPPPPPPGSSAWIRMQQQNALLRGAQEENVARLLSHSSKEQTATERMTTH